MAAVPPGQPIAPGIAGTTFPQWGVTNSTGNLTSTGDTLVEVKTQAEKQAEINKGVLVWFSSKAAAQSFVSSELSPLNGNVPGVGIGGSFLHFLDNLTSRALWVRIAKVTIGVVMILTGINKLTGASNAIDKVAGVAGKAAVL